MTIPDHAGCRGCGYPLRGLSTPTCPECGRSFDPADPATMDLGRRPSLVERFLFSQTGWVPVLLCIAGAIAIVAVSRPPEVWRPSIVDVRYYFRPSGFRERIQTPTDLVYVAGVIATTVAVGYWIVRTITGRLARRWYRRDAPTDTGRRVALVLLASIAAAGVRRVRLASSGGQAVGETMDDAGPEDASVVDSRAG